MKLLTGCLKSLLLAGILLLIGGCVVVGGIAGAAVVGTAVIRDKAEPLVWDAWLVGSGLYEVRVGYGNPFDMFEELITGAPVDDSLSDSQIDQAWALLPAGVSRWRPIVERTAQSFGEGKAFALKFGVIMTIENPHGKPTSKSHAGAQGLSQVMPFHFKAGEDPTDPATNIFRGMKYFRGCLKRAVGNFRLAAVCYNGGGGALYANPANWVAESRAMYQRAAIYQEALNGQTTTLDSLLGGHGAAIKPIGNGPIGDVGSYGFLGFQACLIPNQSDPVLGFIARVMESIGLGPYHRCTSTSGNTTATWGTTDGFTAYWPVTHKISGYRFNASVGYTVSGKHDGVDFGGASGTPVKAWTDGQVIHVGYVWLSGKNQACGDSSVIVDHGIIAGQPMFALYCHLQKSYVRIGEYVQAGQPVGALGSKGNSTGPHLHFHLRRGGKWSGKWQSPYIGGSYIDPLLFMPPKGQSSAYIGMVREGPIVQMVPQPFMPTTSIFSGTCIGDPVLQTHVEKITLNGEYGDNTGFQVFHTGRDYPIKTGTKVIAAETGTVVYVGDAKDGYGSKVIIDHGEVVGLGHLRTFYAHLSKYNVIVGQTITRGQLIAWSGSSGSGTGPHLHFQVEVNGKHRDPRPLRCSN